MCENTSPFTTYTGSAKMRTLFHRLLQDESGATAIEYGLIASLIGVAIIAGATALGTSLNTTFDSISSMINGPAA